MTRSNSQAGKGDPTSRAAVLIEVVSDVRRGRGWLDSTECPADPVLHTTLQHTERSDTPQGDPVELLHVELLPQPLGGGPPQLLDLPLSYLVSAGLAGPGDVPVHLQPAAVHRHC